MSFSRGWYRRVTDFSSFFFIVITAVSWWWRGETTWNFSSRSISSWVKLFHRQKWIFCFCYTVKMMIVFFSRNPLRNPTSNMRQMIVPWFIVIVTFLPSAHRHHIHAKKTARQIAVCRKKVSRCEVKWKNPKKKLSAFFKHYPIYRVTSCTFMNAHRLEKTAEHEHTIYAFRGF